MTSSSSTNGNDDKSPDAGTALTPVAETGLGHFLGAAEAPPPPTRGLGARLLDYSAHAAIVVGLIGFAWTVSSHLASKPTAAQIESPAKVAAAAPAPAAPKKVDELAQLRTANSQLAADIKSLRANLDTLRANAKQDKTAAEMKALEADLKTVKTGLTATKSETDAQIAQLSGKLGKLEHQTVDTTATGSIPPAAPQTIARSSVPTPPSKPAAVKLADASGEDPSKSQVISGWVVRDVYDGVALIEGKHGPMEVVPGVSIPGAGVVKSIARHGNGWQVTTSKGLLAYAAPARDYRRIPPRDYYPPYQTDY